MVSTESLAVRSANGIKFVIGSKHRAIYNRFVLECRPVTVVTALWCSVCRPCRS